MILAIYAASKKLFKHENCSVHIRQGSSLLSAKRDKKFNTNLRQFGSISTILRREMDIN